MISVWDESYAIIIFFIIVLIAALFLVFGGANIPKLFGWG